MRLCMNLFFVLRLIDKHIALTRFRRGWQRFTSHRRDFDVKLSTFWPHYTILTRCGGRIAWF